MKKQKDRVIIDTNLWISYLLTKDYLKLDKIISQNKHTLLFSQELVKEIIEVTQRKKFRKYFPIDDIENLLLRIKSKAEFINVQSTVYDCRDPKDNFLLSLAIDGNATHIITGDKDLLILNVYGKTKIITITEYLSKI